MNIKKRVNEKGSALMIVILILSVGLLFSAALMNYTTTSYKRTLSDTNIEMAYLGSNSALEKSIDYAKENAENLVSTTPYYDDESYANALAGNLLTALNSVDFDEVIDISNSNKTNTEISSVDMLEYSSTEDKIEVLLGISAVSNIESGVHKANNKTGYYKILVELDKPNRFYMNSALNTIGDVLVDGGLTPSTSGGSETNLSKYNYKVYIDGDLNVYGTTPVDRSRPEQWYYGGVMALNNAYLNINGTAYCRSLIRTGLYDKSLTDAPIDKSRIDVEYDVVSQGIQLFGREDKVSVKRDVYTLDDLEINGPDSVIAINGSYFGVSDGKDENGGNTSYHDLSSAIVNSATVHDLSADSFLSKKSRVVINGDVFINGGTFKLNNSGTVLGQIEDSSVAWNNSDDIEIYRSYNDKWNTDPTYYAFDPEPLNPLINSYLYENKDDAVGFGALFQLWPDQSSNIAAWLDNIDATRNYSGSIPNNGLDSSAKSLLVSGYSKIAVAANDSIKFIDEKDEFNSGIVKFNKFNKTNYPSQITELDGFWDDNYELKPWTEYASIDFGISAKLNDLKDNIVSGFRRYNAEFFVQRDKLAEGDSLTPQIQNRATPSKDTSYNSYFDYVIGNVLNKALADSSGCSIIFNGDTKLSDYSTQIDLNKYQIFVVDSVDELIIDTDFNGIIVSKGRVRVANGITIKGSIIAAGMGYDSSTSNVSITSVDSSNLDDLNTGELSAVIFDSTIGSGGTSRVIFDDGVTLKGRIDLLDKIISSGGPDLKTIL
jgi:hypothetical protein